MKEKLYKNKLHDSHSHLFKLLFTSLTSFFMPYHHITTQTPFVVSELSVLLIKLAIVINCHWIITISCLSVLLLHGSCVDNGFHIICWQLSLSFYLLLLYRLRHKPNHCEMCDTQHKYLPFKSGVRGNKKQP